MLIGSGKMTFFQRYFKKKIYIDRYVSTEPIWAKQLEGEVKLGKHLITFTARSPVGDKVFIHIWTK